MTGRSAHRVIYAGLYYVLPLKCTHMSFMWWVHCSMALWLGFNILFNYYCCARTNPGTHDSVRLPGSRSPRASLFNNHMLCSRSTSG